MNKRVKKMLALLLATQLIVGSLFGSVVAANGSAGLVPGTPYDANSDYDVDIPHIIINQFYAGGTGIDVDTPVSHNFIELYNPTEFDVNLTDWTLHYGYNGRAVTNGQQVENWEKLTLNGEIKAHTSFLILGNATDAASPTLDLSDVEADQIWDIYMHNKGVAIVLIAGDVTLGENENPFGEEGPEVADYVDMLSAAGNDLTGANPTNLMFAFENEYIAAQSKQKSIRRVDFSDTDNNKNDAVDIDYRPNAMNETRLAEMRPRTQADGVWGLVVSPGKPYDEEGNYDVTVPHIIVNQFYAGGTGTDVDTPVSHNFIELYNPTEFDVNLTGWTLHYGYNGRGATNGQQVESWEKLTLNGEIKAHTSFLILGNATDAASPTLDLSDVEADQIWDIYMHNKGVAIVLIAGDVTLEENENPFGEEVPEVADYVDMLSAAGNDLTGANPTNLMFAFENEYIAAQSKQKSIRRVDFSDTDNNKNDAVDIDYRPNAMNETRLAEMRPRTQADGVREDDDTSEPTPSLPGLNTNSLNGKIAYIGNYSTGAAPDSNGGIAEIVKFNKDNNKIYMVNGALGSIDIVSVTGLTHGEVTELSLDSRINVSSMGGENGFAYGDVTSVDINTERNIIAIAVQDPDYREGGYIVLLNYDGSYIKHYDAGVQPDMITFTKDGKYVLTADEGEPRMGYGDGNVDPKGSVTIVDLDTDLVTIVDFTVFDSQRDELLEAGVILTKDALPSDDLEPEYVALSGDGITAWVALQEANAIAVLDIENAAFTSIKGLGVKNHNLEENALDALTDGKAELLTQNLYGIYMPDGIEAVQIGDAYYILTANEGDAREWEDYKDIFSHTVIGNYKIDAIDTSKKDGLDTDKTYILGARSFSILNAETLEQVYDSGSDFEAITAEHYPTVFNAGHTNNTLDNRSNKKGPEPEYVTALNVGEKVYAFIGLERFGGVMMYDITDPAEASFYDYINPRDFSKTSLAEMGALGPEGLNAVAAADSPTGYPLLFVANEVSGTISVLEVQEGYTAPDDTTDPDNNGTPSWPFTPPVDNEANEEDGSSGETPVVKAIVDNGVAKATIESTELKKWLDSGADTLVVEAGEARVTADAALLAALSAAGEGNIVFTITESNGQTAAETLFGAGGADVLAQIGTRPFYELKLEVNGQPLTDWKGGEVTVELPYTPRAGEDLNAIVIYYVTEGGELVVIPNGYYDPARGTVSFKTNHFSYYAVGYNKLDYRDTGSSFAKDAITFLSARGILNGVGGNDFAPKQQLTRADFALILARIAGAPLSDYTASSFTDVQTGDYYAGAVEWAASEGIVNGVGEGKFDPKASVTREQIATMIVRFANALHIELPGKTSAIAFTDEASISAYAKTAVQALTKAGIIDGKTSAAGRFFAPQDTATREEAAKILAILLKL